MKCWTVNARNVNITTVEVICEISKFNIKETFFHLCYLLMLISHSARNKSTGNSLHFKVREMIFFSEFRGNKANSMQTQMPILIVTLFVGTMEVSFNLDLAHMCVPVAMWTSYWISNRFRRIGESLCMILAIYIPLLLSSLILNEFYTASFCPFSVFQSICFPLSSCAIFHYLPGCVIRV